MAGAACASCPRRRSSRRSSARRARRPRRAFGDGSIYLEKYLVEPRHIEIQIFGDRFGKRIHLGERECSIQRRHQKLVEEAPSPALEPELRQAMGEAAVRLADAAGYENAGTVEFLLDQDGSFYFMEMNTRIQVEHPVTEMVTGVDLVKLQLKVAAGERSRPREPRAAQRARHRMPHQRRGPGDLQALAGPPRDLPCPGGPGVRVDTHAYEDYVIPPFYDSLVAKLITYGQDRARGDRAHGAGARLLRHRGYRPRSSCTRGSCETRASEPGSSRPASWSAYSTARTDNLRDLRPFPTLYAIADAEALAPVGLSDGVEAMVRAGVGWIQIRAKRMSDDRLSGELAEIERRLDRRRVLAWIDDRADLARLFGMALHLGQTDLPPRAARRVVGPRIPLGLSTHDLEQVRAADADPDVDLVAVGPVFETHSKDTPDPVVGLEMVRQARLLTSKPLVAIGGVDTRRLDSVLEAGADSGVVLGDLCRGDLGKNLGRYRKWLSP